MKDSQAIDWNSLKARVAKLAQLADSRDRWTPSQARAVLAERAAELAKVDLRSEDEAVSDFVSFTVGLEIFAVATRFVHEVIQVKHLVAAPCAPPFLVGVFNYRGTLMPVVDLAPALGLSPWEGDVDTVLVMGRTEPEMAVATGRANDVLALTRDAILPVPDAVSGSGRRAMIGVTREAVTVVDGESLLDDPTFRAV